MAKLLYEGKAKQVYETENPNEYIIHYKDDATAFNGEKKAEISSKGILNNKISTIIFEMLKENNINKIGFSLATLATAPKTLDFPTFFCCWGVAAVAGNVTPKSCVAGILIETCENQKQ